ncbi:hypothetical protein RN001_006618 [Aquatica leii]|uniref:DUF4806 domain-containing protein n=1 Tax=Aquatica leii TaxID=1421715 RepID=A0AAN7PDW4_9COLE|nr:hypothetical protein RN001_006618 [Aquatica leii]
MQITSLSHRGLTPDELQKAVADVVKKFTEERDSDLRKQVNFECDSDDNDSEIGTKETITQDLYSSESEQSADEIDKVSDADEQSQHGDDYLTAKHRAALIQNNELLGCYLPPINLSSASHPIPSSSRESTPISELRSTPVASRETSAVFREEIRKCKTAPWFNPSPGSSRGSTPGFEARPTITDTLEENSAVFLEEIGKCKTCETNSGKYLNLLSTLLEQNKEILAILRNQCHSFPQITPTSLGLPVEFPIKSLEDLAGVEDYLESQGNNDKLSVYLATLDKTSLTSSTNAVLRFCLSYEVAKEFSFLGTRNQKKAFNTYRLKKTIVAAIKSAIPSATNREVDDQIKAWLKRSPKTYALQQQKLNKRGEDGV